MMEQLCVELLCSDYVIRCLTLVLSANKNVPFPFSGLYERTNKIA
jgi:hypothetical protein